MDDTEKLAHLRDFVGSTLSRATATTDAEIRQTAATTAPSDVVGSTNYGMGLRDGVVETCQQVIAFLDGGQ